MDSIIVFIDSPIISVYTIVYEFLSAAKPCGSCFTCSPSCSSCSSSPSPRVEAPYAPTAALLVFRARRMLLDVVFHFHFHFHNISISSMTSDDVRMSTAAISFHLPRRLFGRQPTSFESLREENAPKKREGALASLAACAACARAMVLC